MKCINLESNDPFFNLAIEELLLKNRSDDYLILGINSPSVIIGKHQSAYNEINTKFIFENNIPVIRRISGGGAVYHDLGNLNFSFIVQSEAGKQIDFRKYTLPVIEFLSSVGILAIFEGKNDLKVGGLKISGNAEHVHRDRVLHHGTLLFSTSLGTLRNCLVKNDSLYASRAVRSNPSSVMNLNEKLKSYRDIFEFKSGMMAYFLQNMPEASIFELSASERSEAESIADSKYRTWEWNWAYGPEYAFSNSFQLFGIKHSCNMHIKNGLVRECKIGGSDKMRYASKRLIGCRHMVPDIYGSINAEDSLISEEEVYNFF
jgi:lipoate---protein ligase